MGVGERRRRRRRRHLVEALVIVHDNSQQGEVHSGDAGTRFKAAVADITVMRGDEVSQHLHSLLTQLWVPEEEEEEEEEEEYISSPDRQTYRWTDEQTKRWIWRKKGGPRWDLNPRPSAH